MHCWCVMPSPWSSVLISLCEHGQHADTARALLCKALLWYHVGEKGSFESWDVRVRAAQGVSFASDVRPALLKSNDMQNNNNNNNKFLKASAALETYACEVPYSRKCTRNVCAMAGP